MLHKIYRLRKLLDEQLNADIKDWKKIKELSIELDSIIFEYQEKKDSEQSDDEGDT